MQSLIAYMNSRDGGMALHMAVFPCSLTVPDSVGLSWGFKIVPSSQCPGLVSALHCSAVLVPGPGSSSMQILCGGGGISYCTEGVVPTAGGGKEQQHGAQTKRDKSCSLTPLFSLLPYTVDIIVPPHPPLGPSFLPTHH